MMIYGCDPTVLADMRRRAKARNGRRHNPVPCEADILAAVKRLPGQRARDVADTFGCGVTSAFTALKRMEEHGQVRHELNGRTHLWYEGEE